MKILHLVPSMALGGIEHLVFSMMLANTKEVYIFAIEGSLEETFRKWPALKAYSANIIFANKKKGFRFQVARLIRQTCRKHAISILHSHYTGPLIYSFLAKQGMKSLKQIHTQHDIWHLNEKKLALFEYVILNMSPKMHMVAVSKNIQNELKRLYPRQDISLVYNGIDTNRFKPGNKKEARALLQLPLHTIIIACTGRLEAIKGHTYLIQAMSYLPGNFHLAIAGDGRIREELQKEAERLGLSERITFLGQVETVELVYQACDLFCLPSLHEGLPLSILEAQACSLPVVCTNVGGCKEAVYPQSGRLIPTKNPKVIAEACMELTHTSADPREFILKQFSLTSLMEKYQSIYTML